VYLGVATLAVRTNRRFEQLSWTTVQAQIFASTPIPARQQQCGPPAPAATPARALESLGCGAASDAAAFIIYLAAISCTRPSAILLGRDRAGDPRARRAQAGCRSEAGARLNRTGQLCIEV
jgi:hypothetical protein